MNRIEICILNPDVVKDAEKMMAFGARLTQHGHQVKDLEDALELFNQPVPASMIKNLAALPHPALQKFEAINVVIVGASRRFLAQITRHQNEVKFMSASLQYSDYSDEAGFVIPYDILGTPREKGFLDECKASMNKYKLLIESGISNDEAGYVAPQALRNVLIMSATPFQWKHMIHQRTCKRNTTETRYVMLKIWEALYDLSPALFAPATTGPFCQQGKCLEGRMSCECPIKKGKVPGDVLKEDFSKFYGGL